MPSSRSLVGAVAIASALCATLAGARAWDDAKYPDLKGQWRVVGGPLRYDTTRPWGPGQGAPLTAEYAALFEANVKDQEEGGQGLDQTYLCQSPGMPRITLGYGEMEFIVTPEAMHILIEHIHDSRRIFTDGRDWPQTI